MRRTALNVAAALCIGAAASAFAQGVPVGDAGTWAGLQQQYAQMLQQYETLKSQYATMQQQLSSITGNYGRGTVGLNEAIQSSSVVPGSWQEVVAQQGSGAYGSTQTRYEKLLQTMPQELFADPNGRQATSYKLTTDSVRAAFSGGDVLYGQVQRHLNTLATLATLVEKTQNIKDAQDLNNRINTETGMLQTALAKMEVMNLNLQANALNEQAQAEAETQRYFRRAKSPNSM